MCKKDLLIYFAEQKETERIQTEGIQTEGIQTKGIGMELELNRIEQT